MNIKIEYFEKELAIIREAGFHVVKTGIWVSKPLFVFNTYEEAEGAYQMFDKWSKGLKLIDANWGKIDDVFNGVLWLDQKEETLTTEEKEMNLENTQQQVLADLVTLCYERSKAAGWHTDLNTGELLERNKAEMICLMHSELSEAMEGERKGLMDDKLPHRPMAEVEMADVVIRVFDYCGRWGYDLAGAFFEKLEFNRSRKDFSREERLKENGKKF